MTPKIIKRILYFQHAAALGGSTSSLLYLIQGLNKQKYAPLVCCIHSSPEVIRLYKNNHIKTIYTKGISGFPHTTSTWLGLHNPIELFAYIKCCLNFFPSVIQTYRLTKRINPTIVHLNSLTLLPSALGVKLTGVPLVWHIRETISRGYMGIRKKILAYLVLRLADAIIFISHYDRQQITRGQKGVVVYNFVDFNRFNRNIDGSTVRKEMGLTQDAKVVLFLGGINAIKGIFPLLEALYRLKPQCPNLHCLIGGGIYKQSNSLLARLARKVLPLLCSATVSQQVRAMLDCYHMRDYVHLLAFCQDVEMLIAASDAVVFPSIVPHSARPLIEAAAMAKPVVATKIGGPRELVEDGKTGILVPAADAEALAKAIKDILQDESLAKRLGEGGYKMAREKFDYIKNIKMIEEIYERLPSRK